MSVRVAPQTVAYWLVFTFLLSHFGAQFSPGGKSMETGNEIKSFWSGFETERRWISTEAKSEWVSMCIQYIRNIVYF